MDLKKSEYITIMNKMKKAYTIMYANYSKIFKDGSTDNLDTYSVGARIKIDNTFDVFFPYYKEKNRKRHIVSARHCYFYFLRKYTNMSLIEIASIFEQDHSSIIHALQKVNKMVETEDNETLSIIRIVESVLKQDDVAKV